MKLFQHRRTGLALMGLFSSGVLNAGSFSLYTESNGYSIGNFAAGVAAEAYDASTGWYNPAGLALIHTQQMIAGGVGVLPSTSLSGSTQYNTTGVPPYRQTFSNLQGSETGLVPSFYYAKPLKQNWTAALSVTVPFGLSSNWAPTSPLRYAGTLSKLESVNVSPEIGGKINNHLALGAGVDIQYAQVTFNSVLGSPAQLQDAGAYPMEWDSASVNQGTSWAAGFHIGVLTLWHENHTRLGVNYQSRVNHTFRGKSTLTGPLADPTGGFNAEAVFTSDSLVSDPIDFPEILTLSGYQDVNEKIAVLGSVVYTGWGVFKEIALNNVAGVDTGTSLPSLINFVSTENYRNAWRFALGANYHLTDRWMLRAGGGYDQTPTINAQRTVRIPDADRWALSVGAHYQPYKQIVIDAGYTYLQSVNGTSVNKTLPLSDTHSFAVTAEGKASAQVFGAQVTWLIDKVVTNSTS